MNQQPTARVYAPTITTDSATTVVNEERQEVQRLRYENRILRSGSGYEDPACVARILMEKDAEIERLRSWFGCIVDTGTHKESCAEHIRCVEMARQALEGK